MDKYGGHSDEQRNYNNNGSRHSFDHSHKRESPHDYRNGGGAVFRGDQQRAYDNPQIYPPPHGGGGGGAGFGFGFGVTSGGSGGFRGGDGGGFISVGRDGRGFGASVGGDGGGYQTVSVGGGGGGGGGGYRHGGNGGDGRFGPVGSDFSSISADGLDFQPMAGGGGGFRPMGGGYAGRGSELESFEVKRAPISGQKREYPFSSVERSQERGTGFAKLFVGSVPRTATEDDIRPLFDKHGCVLEVAFIRDKRTGQQQGCCFVKYASPEEADGAIKALHNQYVLPGAVGPIQVRYADGERERLGATEYKLFVGSLNKQATEKEIEEIFLPYGRVEDVYIMRDENKQSRGCGFVKYTNREVAQAAINALNGRYTMRGCDMPLSVRFADPKRPRPGEYRGGPSAGESGLGPAFSAPGNRQPAHGGPPHGHTSTTSWPLVRPQHIGQPSYAGDQGLANQFPTIPTSARMASADDGFPGRADVSHPVPTVSSAQGSKPRPQQQLQPQHIQSSNVPPGQIPASYSDTQTPYSQAQSSHRQASVAHAQLSSIPKQAPVMDNHQQRPAQQSPSQLAQMLSQQKQTLQETFQSSQQALSQLQQQVMQLQPSNRNPSAQQGALTERQQSSWAGIGSQPVPTAANATASPAVATLTPSVTTTGCNWTDHLSPDGYKYYYNSVTGESKWEKPEELISYERQKQQQQKPSSQHPLAQSYPSGPSINHAVPHVQSQFQDQYQGVVHNQIGSLQQASQSSSYQLHGIAANQSQKELGYSQSQIPAGRDHSHYQQGVQAPQWKK